MTMQEKVIRNKVGLLRLGKELGNVSRACKLFGYSRDSFYRFKETLRQRRGSGPSGTHPTQALPKEQGCRGGRRGCL